MVSFLLSKTGKTDYQEETGTMAQPTVTKKRGGETEERAKAGRVRRTIEHQADNGLKRTWENVSGGGGRTCPEDRYQP